MVSIQPNMQAHDELAALFSRNLTFNPEVQAQSQDVPRHLDPVPAPPSNEPAVYSISQHYHHSAHIPKPSEPPEDIQRRSSEPIPGEDLSSETILRIHGIDPSTLTPSQVQLFRIADRPQQRRLLELWSICPPDNGANIPALAWSSTTVEQEEQLARLRYERTQQQQVMSLDGTSVQSASGQWRPQSDPESEPYMASGYEELMRREQEMQFANHAYTQATDPVYMGPDYAREQQQLNMATGYGAFERLRGMGSGDMMDVM
jgi:hypothetical protein